MKQCLKFQLRGITDGDKIKVGEVSRLEEAAKKHDLEEMAKLGK